MNRVEIETAGAPRGTGRRNRVAIVGVGHRASRYLAELASELRDRTEIVGLCDVSAVRMAAQARWLDEHHRYGPVPGYPAERFGQMIAETRPDVVLVATIDSEHHPYIVRALELGCDVVTEKPMTTEAAKCRAILAAAASHPARRLSVALNYRWAPPNVRVREVLADGAIGAVRSVNLEWLLDTRHGADYFRRWHSEKAKSGGLLVHKATHHFDLVNWWLGARPCSVFAMGGLVFYGQANAVARGDGDRTRYPRYTGVAVAAADPFRLDLRQDARLRELYLEAEQESGYLRDRNVFRSGIDIEDDVSVLVRYDGGARLTYSLNAFSPREGMRAVFNGDRGRLEYYLFDRSSGPGGAAPDHPEEAANGEGAAGPLSRRSFLRLFRHFGGVEEIPIEVGTGGHWGGDPPMIRHLFAGDGSGDPLGRVASAAEGAAALLVGVAANESLATGQPVTLASLR